MRPHFLAALRALPVLSFAIVLVAALFVGCDRDKGVENNGERVGVENPQASAMSEEDDDDDEVGMADDDDEVGEADEADEADDEAAEEDDDDERAEAAELPEAIEDAFEDAYPNARIIGSDSEQNNGELVYEIESVDGNVRRDLLYRPDGTLVEYEEAISVDALPAAVRSTASARGSVKKAERLTRGDMVQYEVIVATDSGNVELVLDTEGRVVESSSEEE